MVVLTRIRFCNAKMPSNLVTKPCGLPFHNAITGTQLLTICNLQLTVLCDSHAIQRALGLTVTNVLIEVYLCWFTAGYRTGLDVRYL